MSAVFKSKEDRKVEMIKAKATKFLVDDDTKNFMVLTDQGAIVCADTSIDIGVLLGNWLYSLLKEDHGKEMLDTTLYTIFRTLSLKGMKKEDLVKIFDKAYSVDNDAMIKSFIKDILDDPDSDVDSFADLLKKFIENK